MSERTTKPRDASRPRGRRGAAAPGTRVLVVTAAAAIAVAGCRGSKVEGRLGNYIDTAVDPSTIEAGETADVTCSMERPRGGSFETDLTFIAEPGDGWSRQDGDIRATTAGDYTVRCVAPQLDFTDPDGAPLTVEPGPPSQVKAVLDEPEIAAGEQTGVECVVQDEFGNAIPGYDTEVTADEPVEVGDGVVGSTQANSYEDTEPYEVRCRMAEDVEGIEEVPAELTVAPGPPTELELRAGSDDPCAYAVGATVELDWEGEDQFGNRVPDPGGEVTAPSEGVEPAGDEGEPRYDVTSQGMHTFEVTLETEQGTVSDELTLIIDGTGPEITIKSPSRGQTVQGGAGEFVTVSGSVSDDNAGVATLTLNGQEVELGEQGGFQVDVVPSWGVNLLEAEAEDGCGNSSEITPTFAYSSEYRDFEGEDAQGVAQQDAVEVLLGQDFLDDGDHDPDNVDDLATILEILLSDIDLVALVQEQFGGFPLLDEELIDQSIDLGPFSASLEGDLIAEATLVEPTDIGPTSVTLNARDGGIDGIIELGAPADEKALVLNVELDADFLASLSGSALGGSFQTDFTGESTVSTTITIDRLEILSKIDVAKEPGGPLQVNVASIDTSIEGLQIDPIEDITVTLSGSGIPIIGSFSETFQLSELIDPTQLTDPLLDPITQQLVPLLVDLLEPIIETFAGDLIAGILEMLELDTTIEVPDLLGGGQNPVEMDVFSELSRVAFFGPEGDLPGGGQVGVSLGTFADKQVERDPLGTIQRDGCLDQNEPASFVYDWMRSVGIAARTDALNAGFFALWRAGWLNGSVDVGGLLGDGGLDGLPIPLENPQVELTWLLPPVLNDCGEEMGLRGQAGDLLVDLEAEVSGTPITATMYVDASARVTVMSPQEGQGGVSLKIEEISWVDSEVLSFQGDLGSLNVRDILENQLGSLVKQLAEGQTVGPVEIPPIDVGELVPGIEEGTELQLGNVEVTKDVGFVVIAGDLQ